MIKAKGIQLNDSTNVNGGVGLKVIVTRDENNLITQGMIIGETLRQNQSLIVCLSPGELVRNPTIGASIIDLLLDRQYLVMEHRIREHLEKDGMKVRSVEVIEGQINIDGSYD